LRRAAIGAGIYVFPGFKARSKNGVHILCMFDQFAGRMPQRQARLLNVRLSVVGTHNLLLHRFVLPELRQDPMLAVLIRKLKADR
jgi:hypothetical protein